VDVSESMMAAKNAERPANERDNEKRERVLHSESLCCKPLFKSFYFETLVPVYGNIFFC
jgi:hypothetical protein